MAITYVIQEGDTLSGIAQQVCGDASLYDALAALNNISNPDLIYAGNTLIVDCSAMLAWATGSGSVAQVMLPALPTSPDPTVLPTPSEPAPMLPDQQDIPPLPLA